MERNIPPCLLLLVIFWYSNLQYCCKWNNAKSEPFGVFSGTKQGGVLSPDFFSLYINDLIVLLRKSGYGCHIIRVFIGACWISVFKSFTNQSYESSGRGNGRSHPGFCWDAIMAGFRDTTWPYHSGSDFRLEVLTFGRLGLWKFGSLEARKSRSQEAWKF